MLGQAYKKRTLGGQQNSLVLRRRWKKWIKDCGTFEIALEDCFRVKRSILRSFRQKCRLPVVERMLKKTTFFLGDQTVKVGARIPNGGLNNRRLMLRDLVRCYQRLSGVTTYQTLDTRQDLLTPTPLQIISVVLRVFHLDVQGSTFTSSQSVPIVVITATVS